MPLLRAAGPGKGCCRFEGRGYLIRKPEGFQRQWPEVTIAKDEPTEHPLRSRGQHLVKERKQRGLQDVPEIRGSQGRVCWLLLLQRAEEVGRALAGEEGKGYRCYPRMCV